MCVCLALMHVCMNACTRRYVADPKCRGYKLARNITMPYDGAVGDQTGLFPIACAAAPTIVYPSSSSATTHHAHACVRVRATDSRTPTPRSYLQRALYKKQLTGKDMDMALLTANHYIRAPLHPPRAGMLSTVGSARLRLGRRACVVYTCPCSRTNRGPAGGSSLQKP